VAGQGGLEGPIVTAANVYALTLRALEKLGFKDAGRYLSDPAAAPPTPPRPDPAAARLAGEQQLAAAKVQANLEAARAKAASDLALGRERLAMEFQLKREQAAAEIALKERELAAEAALKSNLAAAGAPPKSAALSEVTVGGEPG